MIILPCFVYSLDYKKHNQTLYNISGDQFCNFAPLKLNIIWLNVHLNIKMFLLFSIKSMNPVQAEFSHLFLFLIWSPIVLHETYPW